MKILCVTVLYKMKPEESPSLRSLAKCRESGNCLLAVYDNSPWKQDLAENSPQEPAFTFHDRRNGGLAAAYNWALELALEEGCPWMLLLDQDTELPAGYIETVMDAVDSCPVDVAALVPRLFCRGRLFSPLYPTSFPALFSFAGDAVPGPSDREISAYNSGAVLRTVFIESLGGFDRRFPLDYLDHWLFRQIYASGHRACILDEAMDHSLSIAEGPVPPERLRSILDGEFLYMLEFRGPCAMFWNSVNCLKAWAKSRVRDGRLDLAALYMGQAARIARQLLLRRERGERS